MKDSTKIKMVAGGFGFFWLLSALAGIATTGLIIYILWRIATHPW